MLLQTVLCRSSDGSAGSEYDLERLLQGVDAVHQESPAPPLLLPPRQPILAPPRAHEQTTRVPSLEGSLADSMGSLQPASSAGIDDGDAEFDDEGSGGSDDGDSAYAASGNGGPSAEMPAMRMRTRGADKPRPPPPPPVGKRKLGRPIMFTGNPDDPSLTKDERRRIRRRAANRASAQRVRERRMQQASLMLTQLSETEARRDALHATLVKTQGEVQHLTMALQQASQGWVAESAKGSRLRSQLATVSSFSMPNMSLGQPVLLAQQSMEMQQPVQHSMPAAGMGVADPMVPGFW